jgi:antirestriction protein ArdC
MMKGTEMSVANFISKKPYSGENVAILEGAMDENEFGSWFFLTYKQAQSVGLQVRKGETGFQIMRVVLVEEFDKKTGQKRTRKAPKYFTVFNLEQCDKAEAEVAA